MHVDRILNMITVYRNDFMKKKRGATSNKIQMKIVGPSKVLAKYGENAYKVDFPSNLAISPVSNVVDLIRFKGEISQQSVAPPRVLQDFDTNAMPKKKLAKEEKVLESRVKKAIRHQV